MAEMMRGARGADVRGWQAMLKERGYVGSDGKLIVVDGDFGANTAYATETFQGRYGLPATGVVDAATFEVAAKLPPLITTTFCQARNFTQVTGAMRTVDLIVIHTMEAPEKGDTAESCANWFATQPIDGTIVPDGNGGMKKFGGTSAHYCISSESIVQCVREKDVAWAAPGANANGIQLEHAGYARQSAADWADDYSVAMLRRSARLAAEICKRYGLPTLAHGPEDLLAGSAIARVRGITTHADVSQAWKKSDHKDPGPFFPMAWYLDRVREELAALG